MAETPRVEFNDDGLSMDIDEAVERFRDLLETIANDNADGDYTEIERILKIVVRPCDCAETLAGRDDYCPLHGEGA